MLRAELIDLVVQFVSNPVRFVILCVVKNCIIDIFFLQAVHHFNFIEVYQGAVWCAARDVFYHICLDADFHLDEVLKKRNPKMKARFT